MNSCIVLAAVCVTSIKTVLSVPDLYVILNADKKGNSVTSFEFEIGEDDQHVNVIFVGSIVFLRDDRTRCCVKVAILTVTVVIPGPLDNGYVVSILDKLGIKCAIRD